MDSKYRLIADKYHDHLKAFMRENVEFEESKLLAAMLAIHEFTNKVTAPKNASSKLEYLKIIRLDYTEPKSINEVVISIGILSSNNNLEIIEFSGEQALRIIFLIKLTLNDDQSAAYLEDHIQNHEAKYIKHTKIEVDRTDSPALHRAINNKIKNRVGNKKLILNTASRNQLGLWKLNLDPKNIEFQFQKDKDNLLF